MSDPAPDLASRSGGASFPSTHWSSVIAAGDTSCPDARPAMAELCRKYWYPLYFFIRRQGHKAEDAQDLTQAFFAHLLEKKCLAVADPHRGRFRTFLLTALKHFIIDQWERATTAKRGGGRLPYSWDAQVAEDRYRSEPLDDLTPEKAYEQRWATALLGGAMDRLQQEYIAAGKAADFDALKLLAWDMDPSATSAEVVAGLNMSQSARRTAVYRLRQRFAQIVRGEIARTVASPDELEDEIRHLFTTFG